MDNSYELVSNTSECTSSNLSSLSLVTYEECCDVKPNLQSAPPLLFSITDANDGNFYKNYHQLILYNAQLESQLATANNFINSLVNKDLKNTKLGGVDYFKSNLDVNSKLGILHNNLQTVKNEMETNGSLISNLKREIEKKEVDISIKSTSVVGLKNKIVELHLEIQDLKQKGMKCNNSLVLVTNELASVKKSEQWYKDTLYECRKQKLAQTQELLNFQSCLSTKTKDCEILKAEILDLQHKYNELSHSSKQIIDDLSSKCLNRSIKVGEEVLEQPSNELDNLKSELQTLQFDLDNHKIFLQSASKQNSILISQIANMQKCLEEKNNLIVNLENYKFEFNSKINHSNMKLQESEDALLKAHKEKLGLQTTLFNINQEKWEITEGINATRSNFAKFILKYNKLKEEIIEKNTQISKLNNQYLDEKTNNLRQLEELKEDLHEYCRKFKLLEEDSIDKLENNQETIRTFETSNLALETKVQNLQKANSCYVFQIEKLCKELQGAKESLHAFHRRTNELSRLRQEHLNTKMETIERLIEEKVTLEWEVDRVQHLNSAFQVKVANLQETIKKLEESSSKQVETMELLRAKNLLLQFKVEDSFEASDSNQSQCQNRKRNLVNGLTNFNPLPKSKSDACVPNSYNSLGSESFVSQEGFVEDVTLLEVKQLKTLLKAKILENKENHQRYETSNRTLLKNIKNYKKQNHLIHNHFKELQCLYKQVTEQLESCKRENNAKDCQIANLTQLCNDSNNTTVVNYESPRQKRVEDLLLDVETLQNDLDSANSDKYFLQRLCKDLKFSLQTSTSQVAELKKQVLAHKTSKFNTLTKMSSPTPFDDTRVKKLLQQSSAIDSPFGDIECCISSFKEKVVCLQNEVIQTFI